jgi:hypothetical protein
VLLFYTNELTDASAAMVRIYIRAGNNAGTSAFQRILYVIDNTKTPHLFLAFYGFGGVQQN